MSSPFIRTPLSNLTRRAAMATFVVGAGALVTGCTTDGEPERASGRRRREADKAAERDPDVALAALAVAGERSALDAVTATIERHADLAVTLTHVLDAHRAHVSLLADAAPDEAAGASPSPTPEGSPTPDASPGSTDRLKAPARPKAALHRLSLLEQDLSLANKRHAFVAESGAFARMLASMAASAAQHAWVLGEPPATEQAGR